MADGSKLTAAGIPYPVATEIARQITAGVGVAALPATTGQKATALANGINGANLTEKKLADAGWSPHQAIAIAKLFNGTL